MGSQYLQVAIMDRLREKMRNYKKPTKKLKLKRKPNGQFRRRASAKNNPKPLC